MSKVRMLVVLLAAAVIGGPLDGQAWAAPPAPVTNLHLSSADGLIYVSWTASPDTASANVCWLPGSTPPASPSTPGATCSGVLTATGYNFAGTKGQQYGVSVFSYDSTAQVYGDPASGTVTAVDAPPLPAVRLSSAINPYDDRALTLHWADNPANSDTQDYLVSWAAGLGTPAVVDDSHHATDSPEFDIGSLRKNVVYTFAVRVRDGAGQLSKPTVVHAATRTPGSYLLDDKHKNNARVRSTGAQYSDGLSGAANLQPDGHLRTVYDTAYEHSVSYVSRASAAAGWSKTALVAPESSTVNPLFMDATQSGRVVVAGTDGDGTWVRERVNDKWLKLHVLNRALRDRVVGVTGDESGREHVLVHRAQPAGGLFYLTHRSSGWVKTKVPGTNGADTGLIARDPVTNNVVVVDGHRSSHGTTIRYAVLKPTASKVTGLRTWLTSGSARSWTPSSVTSNAGRITLAVLRSSTKSALDGPYVMWARGKTHHSPVRVRGTGPHDTDVVVTALQAGSVQLTFRRTSDAWDPKTMGVYVARWSGRPKVSGWSFSTPAQWTSSAYDFPVAAFRSADGHLYVTFRTSTADVAE